MKKLFTIIACLCFVSCIANTTYEENSGLEKAECDRVVASTCAATGGNVVCRVRLFLGRRLTINSLVVEDDWYCCCGSNCYIKDSLAVYDYCGEKTNDGLKKDRRQ